MLVLHIKYQFRLSNKNSSYNRIIKATGIFGGSQLVSIVLGVLRTKIVALLIGTVGVGLIGVFQSIIDTVRSVTSLGLDTGAVKEIASAASSEDTQELSKSISIFKKWFLWTALIGFLSCIVFCLPISIWVFDDVKYSMHIAALSVCVFLAILATGRSAILQGLSKISYMAKASLISAVGTILIVIPIYYFFGVYAVVPALALGNLAWFFSVDYYYKKLNIRVVTVENKEIVEAGLNTLKLGIFIVLSTVLSTVSMLLIRTYLITDADVETAGLFQAVWTITNIYLALILKSMGTDYFPRLCGVIDKKREVRTLINEQTYIVLIIASPIIVGMLVFSELILPLLYSVEFSGAASLLQWQVLGTFFKVMAWPVAFILLAKNKGPLHFVTECIFYGVYLVVGYLLFPYYGLDALGIGYLIAYIVYFAAIFIMGRSISGFAWSSAVAKIVIVNVLMILFSFYIVYTHLEYAYISGGVIFILSLIYAYYNLRKVFGLNDIKNWFKSKRS